MLPRLEPGAGLRPEYHAFASALRADGFAGEIATDYGTRLTAATDNSVYQLVPQLVLFPRHTDDVVRLARLAGRPRQRAIQLSPRGGGTGTNGQSLCAGAIVDLSRHLSEIVELRLDQGWVRVQPGVVLDQLNAFLRPHGVFFAPNLSPSDRATIGGMIGTDACGKGSRIYGKTSNHLLELELVLLGGSRWNSHALSPTQLAQVRERPDCVGHAVRAVHAVVTRERDRIRAQFPKLRRFMSGYNLAHVCDEAQQTFNLNPLIAGSEGTLCFVTEATLRLTPLPKCRALIAIRYPEFSAALRAAQSLVQSDPGAIETVDDTIVELARRDVIWRRAARLVQGPGEAPLQAINLVEFETEQGEVLEAKLRAFTENLERERGRPGRCTGYTVARSAEDIAALWSLRKKGVGLLGATRGDRRPVPFVEDTAVPPERLADYIGDFRALLDRHGLRYGMFGHVDVGCLHVRPALNLRDPEDDKRLRALSDEVVALVQRYGGVLWAEHGKGFRSEYNPVFFGPELYRELCRIKAAFDPHNQLNPGKLAVARVDEQQLVSVDAVKRGTFDRQIGDKELAKYEAAVSCNGNAQCFDWNPDSLMCPSSKITRDRIHSPKGRSSMLREWLRLCSQAGFEPTRALGMLPSGATLLASARSRASAPDDFSHQVLDAMEGCLACRACATECPLSVDVPSFRSEFLALYHTRYRRPARDYFVATLEQSAAAMARSPGLFNRLVRSPVVRRQMERVGLVDVPLLSEPSVERELRRRGAPRFELGSLRALNAEQRQDSLLLVQDAFTSFYEAHVLLAAYDLLRQLGYRVWVMPFFPNGKGLHVRGFLPQFQGLVRRNTARLREAASAGVALVGLDPAVTLTYRDEYCHALGEESPGFQVQLLQEWLVGQLPRLRPKLEPRARRQADAVSPLRLYAHCIERTLAPRSQRQWQEVFLGFGLELESVSLGCCGMSGVYGHEAEHRRESQGIFELSWAKHLPSDPQARHGVLAAGHSCRSQLKRFAGIKARHPVEVLLSTGCPFS